MEEVKNKNTTRLVVCNSVAKDINILEPSFLVAVVPETDQLIEEIKSVVRDNMPLVNAFGFGGKPVTVAFPFIELKVFAINDSYIGSNDYDTLFQIQEIFESLGNKSFVVEEAPHFNSDETECKNITVLMKVIICKGKDPKIEIIVNKACKAGEELEYSGEIDVNSLLNDHH